jgi:hypothetical protein
MVEQKPEEVSSSLKDKLLILFLSFSLISSCESSFNNFDENLLESQLELEEFADKSNIRKEELLETEINE